MVTVECASRVYKMIACLLRIHAIADAVGQPLRLSLRDVPSAVPNFDRTPEDHCFLSRPLFVPLFT